MAKIDARSREISRRPDVPQKEQIRTEPANPVENAPSEEGLKRGVEAAFDMVRETLNGFDDYALFGSGALYLRKRAAGEEYTLPGDIDIICPDVESLKEIRRRLSRLPGVTIEGNKGEEFKRFPGQLDAFYFSGTLNIDGHVIPFECFSEKRIAGAEDVYGNRSAVQGGLIALNGEGLKNQYLNSLEMEGRIDREVRNVLEPLTSLLLRGKVDHDKIATKMKVTPEDIAWFEHEIIAHSLEDLLSNPELRKEAAQRFAGIKTKTAERLTQVKELQQISEYKTVAEQEADQLRKAA